VAAGTEASAIDYFWNGHPLRRFASAVSFRARKGMFATFMRELVPAPDCTIVDVGVTPERASREANFFEALYPYKHKLTATSIEDASYLESEYPGVRFVQTDGDRLPFGDKAFDVVVSFAVLEHVGDRERQRRFLAELMRVGRRLFLTTPNRWHPIEFHTIVPFIHWLPQKLHQAILRRIGLRVWAETSALNLVTKKDIAGLLPANSGARIESHKLFGIPSNLIVIID
jgi:SAM-dependent methyltransferase